MKYKVSVIIPIYKVEKFIKRCAIALFEQSLTDVEFIFIDDCTPDSSIKILEQVIQSYPQRLNSIKIVRHDVNKGLPSARNSGLKLASGEFIFHCDSDDWLESNAMELLYDKAKVDQADIVWCDWYLSFNKNERYMHQGIDKSGIITGKEAIELILGGQIKYNVWNKLVKRRLYSENQIKFPDGFGMGEDMTMLKVFAFSQRVSYLNKALYHYAQTNSEAFTASRNPAHLEQIKHNVDHIVCFLNEQYGDTLNDYIHFFKLNIKLPFLITFDKKSYDRWNSWYTESNAYISKNPNFNFRIRFIQHMAIKKQYWVLQLYYIFIIKFVYGIIYR